MVGPWCRPPRNHCNRWHIGDRPAAGLPRAPVQSPDSVHLPLPRQSRACPGPRRATATVAGACSQRTTTTRRIPESSALFFWRHLYATRDIGIFGIDVGLEPGFRDPDHAGNARQGDLFQQELVNQGFRVIRNAPPCGIGHELALAGFAHPFGLTSMNPPIFDHLVTLAAWAVHRLLLCLVGEYSVPLPFMDYPHFVGIV